MNLQTLTLSTLKPAPYNPRKISDDAMGRLEKSVKEWGIVDPLIVNKATGYTIIGGHQRFKVHFPISPKDRLEIDSRPSPVQSP